MAFNLPAKSKRGLRQIPNWPAKFGIYYLRRRALPEIIAQESQRWPWVRLLPLLLPKCLGLGGTGWYGSLKTLAKW